MIYTKSPLWYLKRVLLHLILIVASIMIGLPFLWMVSTALKTPAQVAKFPPQWWPNPFKWDNFVIAWNLAPFGRFYINSI